MFEREYIALVDGVHQLVKAQIVLVWGRLNTHVSHKVGDLIDARAWLTVFTLPAYAPELNAVEYTCGPTWNTASRTSSALPSTDSPRSCAAGSSDSRTAPTSSAASSPGPDSPSTSRHHQPEAPGQLIGCTPPRRGV
ncbi:transposase [Streptomyces sp. AS02]|uniref:transposase n=1 Tax=Streptomyces sp. AS02 TaxID=2938946 RepID=UPI00202135F5|nr:transposase [Streptomyces sp. AS02]MCL8017929.1 transposase [Streptomyces sp. AS02]